MEYLAARGNHNICWQGRAGQAGRVPTNAAERRQLLDDVLTGVEIEVAGLNAALQSDRGLRAIGRDDAAVIADAIVYCQVASHLPAVLHISAADTARTLREKNVALVL